MKRSKGRPRALGLACAMASLALGLVVACSGDDDSASGGSAAHAGRGGTGNSGGHASSGKSGSGASGQGGAAGGGGTSSGRGGTPAGGGMSGNTDAGNAGAGMTGANESGCHPVLTNGMDTGIDQCTDGTFRRRAAKRCPLPATTNDKTQCSSPSCDADSDCTPLGQDEPVAICADAHHLQGYCGCWSGCREDADCGPGSICDCGGYAFGQCVPATCRVNSDCAEGLHCVRSALSDLGGGAGSGDGGEGGRAPCVVGYPPTFVCQTPTDECRTNFDCGNDECVVLDGKHVCIRECPI